MNGDYVGEDYVVIKALENGYYNGLTWQRYQISSYRKIDKMRLDRSACRTYVSYKDTGRAQIITGIGTVTSGED